MLVLTVNDFLVNQTHSDIVKFTKDVKIKVSKDFIQKLDDIFAVLIYDVDTWGFLNAMIFSIMDSYSA